jgi:hypothetical protein
LKIVHVELPRLFTLSVKEYTTDVAAAMQNAGHEFEQYDINPCFWKWVLGLSTPHSPRDLFEPISTADSSKGLWAILAELKAHFLDLGKFYGVPISLAGLQLPRAVMDSSYAMCSLVADNFGSALFANFFQQLDARLHFRNADLICLGLEGQQGVFWAVQLAAWLKAAGSTAHISIASHAWENFSLLPHIADLAKNPWFFGVISSVILYQEDRCLTLTQLTGVLGGAQIDSLQNIAIKTKDGVKVLPPLQTQRTQVRVANPSYEIPHRYFEAMDVPADRLVYCMAMVRNKCFYKKCTFCVQIAKHISDHAYSEAAEVQRALQACGELLRHGVSMVNFIDEAMRPVDIRDFCVGIQSRHLPIRWVGRMIAAAHPSAEILLKMKEAGCTEILFGLETFDPRLSADMGKISKSHDDAAETSTMIERFLNAGLFVILSMIYEFPTETPESRRLTLESISRLRSKSDRFAMIFNRFHLMHESQVYKDPATFNIDRIETRLPESDLQYHFQYACRIAHPPATTEELAMMNRLRLGFPEDGHTATTESHPKDLLEMAYFLDYVSIGFQYRVQNDAMLLSDLFAQTH